MSRKLLALCILSANAISFGQSDQPDSAGLEKIKKYMSLGMYEEAASAIESSVKQNEFDPYLRYLYGDVLVRQERYSEALKQFELCSRLDTGSWQALQRVATTAEMIRLNSKSLADDDPAKFGAWLKAYNSWKALARFSEKAPVPQNSELSNLQTTAQQTIKSYEKPVGTWQSTENNHAHYFVVAEKSAGLFTLYMKDSPKIDLSLPLPKSEYVELKETTRGSCDFPSKDVCMTLVGRSGGQVYESCICDVDYTATVSQGYTVLRLSGQIRKVYGPDTYSCRALRNWGPVDRVFEYLSRVQ